MERLLTVEFGPSRSKRFGKALAEARSRAGECTEVEPGRYRASFVLGEDAAAYAALASLLERVRHWRATDVYEEDEPVSTYHAKDIKLPECPKKAQAWTFNRVVLRPWALPTVLVGSRELASSGRGWAGLLSAEGLKVGAGGDLGPRAEVGFLLTDRGALARRYSRTDAR